MAYADSRQQLTDLRQQITNLRAQIRDLQSKVEPETVDDYELSNSEGSMRLSELFGQQDTLFVVHNMGTSCSYCTLWADGLNGVLGHLENRAAFVLSSPDSPRVQQEFARKRGWNFQMISHQGTNFAADMGYANDDGFHPGVSVFRRDGENIIRVSDTAFGPGDDFCLVWHLFDLIPEGPNGWQPRYDYS